jgi:hypothetical protein
MRPDDQFGGGVAFGINQSVGHGRDIPRLRPTERQGRPCAKEVCFLVVI